ncbi:MAG: hypothetical protein II936_07145, partial [Oscillospiraceae bacterium]|nr:hypothetical protein [Oscillospiraceae bacterium]
FSYNPVIHELIAAEVDMGDKRLIEIIKGAINGENDVTVSRDIISAVTKCHNKELHDLLGKMLVAARLEEGLRQAICESMDMGTVDAFLTLLDVIKDNGLLRFSSVKRAMGTWLGIIPDETAKLDRVSDKQFDLVYECLHSPKTREEYLASEDTLKIYTALWAYGFYETKDMLEKIEEISSHGSEHQILTAGYMAYNLGDDLFMHRVAKKVFEEHEDDHRILAMYSPCLLAGKSAYQQLTGNGGYVSYDWGIMRLEDNKKIEYGSVRRYVDLSDRFSDRKDMLAFYELLKRVFSAIKGKEEKYSEVVFKWMDAVLKKSDIAEKICLIASGLQDNALIDEAAELIPQIENRSNYIELMLTKPETPTQLRLLTSFVCDKESYARKRAFSVIKNAELGPENYAQLEDMLRYKNSEMRANTIDLLMKQDDDALYGTITRLLSDKKEEKRTAGLDMIMRLKKAEDGSPLFEKCRALAVADENTGTAERILIDSINPTGDEPASELAPLFSDDDVYTPETDEEFINKANRIFVRYFPNSCVSEKKSAKKTIFSKISDLFSKETAANAKDADFLPLLKKLDDLINEHRNDEFTLQYSNETVTLGTAQNLYVGGKKDGRIRHIVFEELWDSFYENEIQSPVMLVRMYMSLLSEGDHDEFSKKCGKIIGKTVGQEFVPRYKYEYHIKLLNVCLYLCEKYCPTEDMVYIGAAFLNSLKEFDTLMIPVEEKKTTISFMGYFQATFLIGGIVFADNEQYRKLFPVKYAAFSRSGGRKSMYLYGRSFYVWSDYSVDLDEYDYIRAYYTGALTKGQFYRVVFRENKWMYSYDVPYLVGMTELVTNLYSGIREINAPVSIRTMAHKWQHSGSKYTPSKALGIENFDELPEDKKQEIYRFVSDVYSSITERILSAELRRGDTETEYSAASNKIARIYGIDKLIAVLSALGKMTLERSTYTYSLTTSKKSVLSHLLSVCVPDHNDDAQKLRAALKGTDITEKRLIEAAMYSTEWLDIVGEYLNWDGFRDTCWYFIAHMNEEFDDKRKA